MLRVGVKQTSRAARPCALFSGIVLTWAAKPSVRQSLNPASFLTLENPLGFLSRLLLHSRQDTAYSADKFHLIPDRDLSRLKHWTLPALGC
jgi:hypothetical protein